MVSYKKFCSWVYPTFEIWYTKQKQPDADRLTLSSLTNGIVSVNTLWLWTHPKITSKEYCNKWKELFNCEKQWM